MDVGVVGQITSPATLSSEERDFKLCLADVRRGFRDKARRKESIAPVAEVSERSNRA